MKTAEQTLIEEPMPDEPMPEEPSPEAGTFTRYVYALEARSDAVGELVEEVWEELKKTLVREMRWRSLWSSPPAFVGVLEGGMWVPAATPGSALEEFLAECYHFIFAKNLHHLINQLKVKKTIDGMVVLTLRHFLTDRQRVHDPLGYRLFEMLCGAVRAAVEDTELRVLKGDQAIRNETVLGVGPGRSALKPASGELASGETLEALVARWNETLLPGLVTATHGERAKVSRELRERLSGLPEEGVEVFRFKDLLDAIKRDVRNRWRGYERHDPATTAIEGRDDDGTRLVVQLLHPETRVEDHDSFKKLVRCVTNRIPKVDERRKTREYLRDLWNFLRRWSVGLRESLPSHRELERELGIPRDRFPGLYTILGQLARRCQGKLSGAVVEIGIGRPRGGGGGSHGKA